MNRNAAFGLGALLGAATALVWDRRPRLRGASAPAPGTGRHELHEKLAEAKRATVDEGDFGAAGMGGETLVEDTAPPRPPAPPPQPPEARPTPPPAPAGPPPADEFEAMRRRIHEEGKAAAEEMRSPPEQT